MSSLEFRLKRIDETRSYLLDEINHDDLMDQKNKKTCSRQTQYNFLSYRIDLYFHDYKLEIEVDENDRNIDDDIKRQMQQNKSLVVNLLELILTANTLIF